MPLTGFQTKIALLLAANRTPDSYLAGGAAIHLLPNSRRFSNDLDFFHDSEKRVADAFAADRSLLESSRMKISMEISLPGYVRALVKAGRDDTKIEWAHDSAWRFMPVLRSPEAGYVLSPIDLATNKILALAGRDEARDFLDVLWLHEDTLPLGALIWAAVGKDPGFTPFSLLELIRRRGHYHPADFERLRLTRPADPIALKTKWLEAVEEAELFVRGRPPQESGCLYYSPSQRRFVVPDVSASSDVVPHFGRPGGVFPGLLR